MEHRLIVKRPRKISVTIQCIISRITNVTQNYILEMAYICGNVSIKNFLLHVRPQCTTSIVLVGKSAHRCYVFTSMVLPACIVHVHLHYVNLFGQIDCH